jgi:hypothetical protein
MSDGLKDLYAALVKAQGQIEGATKERRNDHFKTKYADLASVWDAIRLPLSTNGLCVIQLPETDADGKMVLRSILAHSGGATIETVYPLRPTQDTPQGLGSAITYARRYTLMAMVGVAPEDDDGNAASGHKPQDPPHPPTKSSGLAGDLSALRIYNGSSVGRMPSAEAKRRGISDELQAELQQCQSAAEIAQFLQARQPMINTLPLTWLEPLENAIMRQEDAIREASLPRPSNGRHVPQSTMEAG